MGEKSPKEPTTMNEKLAHTNQLLKTQEDIKTGYI
jgi:hypothetical protein